MSSAREYGTLARKAAHCADYAMIGIRIAFLEQMILIKAIRRPIGINCERVCPLS